MFPTFLEFHDPTTNVRYTVKETASPGVFAVEGDNGFRRAVDASFRVIHMSPLPNLRHAQMIVKPIHTEDDGA